MVIYVIFICFHALGYCQPTAETQIHGVTVFDSRSACNRAMMAQARANGVTDPKLDKRGRFIEPSGNWYTCLHRHVDTWSSN